ncbi:MAG: hypothetical protein BWY89_01122 [Bacteroidetes bacterium ADurb.BinA012]|nr:MAG: hypothetical protein BWY89_01122 [Bacteroidetes bacterium ADurb.BinA012]
MNFIREEFEKRGSKAISLSPISQTSTSSCFCSVSTKSVRVLTKCIKPGTWPSLRPRSWLATLMIRSLTGLENTVLSYSLLKRSTSAFSVLLTSVPMNAFSSVVNMAVSPEK